MKILIGTPAYGYQVSAEYHASVLRLVQEFGKHRPAVSFESRIVGSAMLALNRNVLAAFALKDAEVSHLLFLDADMGFRPELIGRMMDFDKPVVGCIYPNRERRLARVVAAAGRGASAAQAVDAGHTYVGVPLLDENDSAERRGDFFRAAEVGTGILLIKREALEQMVAAFPELMTEDVIYREFGLGRTAQLFDPFQSPEGLFYSEDVAFCRRWLERCQGEIWACYNARITHVGRDRVVANYADRLTAPAEGGIRYAASLR